MTKLTVTVYAFRVSYARAGKSGQSGNVRDMAPQTAMSQVVRAVLILRQRSQSFFDNQFSQRPHNLKQILNFVAESLQGTYHRGKWPPVCPFASFDEKMKAKPEKDAL